MSDRRNERRKFAREFLGGKCVKCGSRTNLEFDHIDPATKESEIADIWTSTWPKFIAELRKCQLLCKECHQAKTIAENYPARQHGKIWTYERDGCRCPLCVNAYRTYHREYGRERRKRRKAALTKEVS